MTEHMALTERPAEILAPDPMRLIQQALSTGTSPEVVRELVALQQSMERFNWEREERQAKIDFDTAMNECQQKIGRVAPNQKRENNIGWADYVQLDKTIRPVYIGAGFSISFSEVESSDKNKLRMCATVSRGGISREYFADISRAPTNGKTSQLDADAAAASRIKRYLILSIFNIAVGIDKDEKKGAPGGGLDTGEIDGRCEDIENAATKQEVAKHYFAALEAAGKVGDNTATKQFIAARDKRMKEIA